MSGMGYTQHIWTKELDDKLLAGISKGYHYTKLSIYMNMSYATILHRLKDMGFNGLKDARNVMYN